MLTQKKDMLEFIRDLIDNKIYMTDENAKSNTILQVM